MLIEVLKYIIKQLWRLLLSNILNFELFLAFLWLLQRQPIEECII